MIEQVERVRSDLPRQPFGNLGVLHQRKVDIRKSRSDHYVASQVSKRVPLIEDHRSILDVRYCGRGAVQRRSEAGLHRPADARPNLSGEAREGSIGCVEIDWIAGLQLD